MTSQPPGREADGCRDSPRSESAIADSDPAGQRVEQVFREEWGRVLASLIGLLGDFDLAEEAAQEAFAIAAARWPTEGTPANPRAWLVTTARNRAIDRIRRERVLAAKTQLLEAPEPTEVELDDTTFRDERLELLFTCCHPALALDAQVALSEGAIVLIAEQDRRLWDQDQIERGRAALERALALGGRGPYVLQAAIALAHVEDSPDWQELALLYGELAQVTGSPVVALNHAAAVAEAGDVERALDLIEGLDLSDYHYLHATRGGLLRRLHRGEEARRAYQLALELVHSDPERRFLERRLEELGG